MKICLNDRIHRLSKFPESFKALMEAVLSTFEGKLPKGFDLKYQDHEGDDIMLCSETDYQAMLDTLPLENAKVLKVFIISTEETDQNQPSVNNEVVINSENAQIQIEKQDSFEKVEEKKVEEKKVEEEVPEMQEVEKLAEVPQENNEESVDPSVNQSEIKSEMASQETQPEEKEDKRAIYLKRIQETKDKLDNPKLSDLQRIKISNRLNEEEEKYKKFIEREEGKAKKAERVLKEKAEKEKRKDDLQKKAQKKQDEKKKRDDGENNEEEKKIEEKVENENNEKAEKNEKEIESQETKPNEVHQNVGGKINEDLEIRKNEKKKKKEKNVEKEDNLPKVDGKPQKGRKINEDKKRKERVNVEKPISESNQKNEENGVVNSEKNEDPEYEVINGESPQ